MAILVRCSNCYRWGKPTDKICGSGKKKGCGANLQSLKKAKKVNYYVDYLLPNGKAKREKAGTTLEEARAAEGKRLGQRYETPGILEKVGDDRITFDELKDWYFSLASIQNKASYKDWSIQVGKFCKVFGDRSVGSLKVLDLEEHQIRRLEEGLKSASIDLEIQLTSQMMRKAVDNDMVSMDCLKPFTRLKRLSSKGENARKRRMEIEEYVAIKPHLPIHADQGLTLLYYTGMRVAEPFKLTWDMIDWTTKFITLPAEITKTKTERRIPVTPQLAKILKGIPRDLRCSNVIVFRGRVIKQLGQRTVKKAFEDAGYEHGQKKKGGLVLRDTRRSVSSFMERIGIPESHRKLIIGHKRSGMDAHYVHPNDEELHESMEKYHSWLEEQINLVQNLDKAAENA